jgi:hypothetical protein
MLLLISLLTHDLRLSVDLFLDRLKVLNHTHLIHSAWLVRLIIGGVDHLNGELLACGIAERDPLRRILGEWVDTPLARIISIRD